jgi:hypothetical protein
LHILIPSSDDAIAELTKDLEKTDDKWWDVTNRVKDSAKIRSTFQNRSKFKLNDLEPFAMSVFRLGSEMPEVSRLALHGTLHPDHARAIPLHESKYGDCSFEFLREEKVAKVNGCTGSYIKKVYVWKRKNEAVARAVRGKDLDNTASLMRQWVPSLSKEFLQALVDEGLRNDQVDS